MAADATTADVVATVVSVMDAAEAHDFIDSLSGVCGRIVDAAGAVDTSTRWNSMTSDDLRPG